MSISRSDWERELNASTQAGASRQVCPPELRVPALTVLAHPDLRRVGERVLLPALGSGRTVPLSRLSPLFAQPGDEAARPLADSHLSRQPFSPRSGGAAGLDPDRGGDRRRPDRSLRRPVGGGDLGRRDRARRRPPARRPRGAAPPPSAVRPGARARALRPDRRQRRPGPPVPRDPAGRRGRHAGPAARRDRHRQGAGGAGHPRRRDRGGTAPISRSTWERSRRRSPPRSSSARRAAPSPGRTAGGRATSSAPTAARCSWTRSARRRRRCRSSCCARWRAARSSRSASEAPLRVDVRIVAATDADLETAVAAGAVPGAAAPSPARLRDPAAASARAPGRRRPPARELPAAGARGPGPGEPPRRSRPARPALAAGGPGGAPGRTTTGPATCASSATSRATSPWAATTPSRPSCPRRWSGRSPPRPPARSGLPAAETVRPAAKARAARVEYRPISEISDDELLAALRASRWNLAGAAGRLRVSRTSLYARVERHGGIRKAGDLSREEIAAALERCRRGSRRGRGRARRLSARPQDPAHRAGKRLIDGARADRPLPPGEEARRRRHGRGLRRLGRAAGAPRGPQADPAGDGRRLRSASASAARRARWPSSTTPPSCASTTCSRRRTATGSSCSTSKAPPSPSGCARGRCLPNGSPPWPGTS